MMKTKIQLAMLLLITTFQYALAQRGVGPSPDDIALAKSLREKHKKDDVAILSSTEKVSFGQQDDNVTANLLVKEQLMNINHRADIHKYEFYDSQSEIENFSLRYKNDKKTGFQVKDQLYTSNDMFYNDYRVRYVEMDFPVQGYSYSYELEKKFKDVKYFTSLYFNDEFPILKKELEISVPDWLDVEIKEFNFEGYAITKKIEKKPADNVTVYTYIAENLNPYYKESSAPGHSHIYPHLLVLAKSYQKDGKKTELFNTTADLYKWYKLLVNDIDEQPDALKEKVNQLTANAKTDEEKIKNIYYWVQDNIRYIAFEDGLAGFKPDAAQNVFNKRYGDCKGMANLTKQMLRQAGFDARLTWIGTKSIAYDYSIPSLGVDNHMICTLVKDGKKYFLDGTEKYNSFGEYAERIQGKEVMIENGDSYIIDKVPIAPAASNLEVIATTFSIENDVLTGNVKGNYKGESRASFLYGFNNIKNDKKEKSLEFYLTNGDNNIAVADMVTSDLNNRDNTLTLDYGIRVKNRISSFDNEMYIDLDYDEEMAGLDFTERKTAFEFNYKKDYKSVITLQLPAGYKVERLPESFTSQTSSYTISATYEQKENIIVYTKHFVINNGEIKTSEFSNWNEAIKKLKGLYNDQITLTKIQ